MKRANNTGCVTKLSGNRRNPWYAKVSNGYNEKGSAIIKILSDDKGQKYFKDRTIPDLLLATWNKEKGNVDIDKTDYTFSQVYEEYKSKYFPTKEEIEFEKRNHQKAKGKLGKSVASNLQSAYNKCTILHNRLQKSLRKDDYMNIILNTVGCGTVIYSLSNLFKKLDNYALEQDIILKGYAALIDITEDLYLPTQNEGVPYSYKEIDIIWNYSGDIIADITLSTIYAGNRIEELLFTKTADVHLDDGYFIAGLKTTSGKRRIIPIHHELLPIFRKYYNPDNEFLFTINNDKIDYDKQFLPSYNAFMEKLGMEHKTHDGRKTLHSELDRLKANKVCVNKIFGHKSGDIGDDTYSKKGLEELKNTIELVDYRSKVNTKITYLKLSC
jgi:integrase